MKKGRWSVEEDSELLHSISLHGAHHWDFIARSSGLQRTGHSCRLRWLNYLSPKVRRHDRRLTLEEQLLVLQLHLRWGNRWSHIAKQLPGRTDNDVKNYWRTKVEKHAKRLSCGSSSTRFRTALSHTLIPRLMEQILVSRDPTESKSTLSHQQRPLSHPQAQLEIDNSSDEFYCRKFEGRDSHVTIAQMKTSPSSSSTMDFNLGTAGTASQLKDSNEINGHINPAVLLQVQGAPSPSFVPECDLPTMMHNVPEDFDYYSYLENMMHNSTTMETVT